MNILRKRKFDKLLDKYYKCDDTREEKKIVDKLYAKFGTNATCPRCGNGLLKSDLKDYKYLCIFCDENFYD